MGQDYTSSCLSLVYLSDGFSLDSPKSNAKTRIWVQDNASKLCEGREEIQRERVYQCTGNCMNSLYSIPLGIALEMVWRQQRVVPWLSEEAEELSHKLLSLLIQRRSLQQHDLHGASSFPHRQMILHTQRRPSDRAAQEAIDYLLTSQYTEGIQPGTNTLQERHYLSSQRVQPYWSPAEGDKPDWGQCYGDFHSLLRTSQARIT